MRINEEIRSPKVRLINQEGKQVGVLSLAEALVLAEEAKLDLVEIVPTATPPVCKIINYGKYRYDQTKREKESKKAQHHNKVKEIKFRPNIDTHDFEVKVRRAQEFLARGHKVKVTCMFRGRELAHTEFGERLVRRFCDSLEDVAMPETEVKRMGRFLHVVLAPTGKKKQ